MVRLIKSSSKKNIRRNTRKSFKRKRNNRKSFRRNTRKSFRRNTRKKYNLRGGTRKYMIVDQYPKNVCNGKRWSRWLDGLGSSCKQYGKKLKRNFETKTRVQYIDKDNQYVGGKCCYVNEKGIHGSVGVATKDKDLIVDSLEEPVKVKVEVTNPLFEVEVKKNPIFRDNRDTPPP